MADHLGLYCVIGFLIQLLFSFLKGSVWVRLIPLFGILGCMVFSMISFWSSEYAYFLLYYIGWGVVLFAAESAWLVYGVVKLFKNAKKDL